jgi:hypothetical protein
MFEVVLGFMVAGIGVGLWLACAAARRDASCEPERGCGNCGRLGLLNSGKICAECTESFPMAPHWIPGGRRNG